MRIGSRSCQSPTASKLAHHCSSHIIRFMVCTDPEPAPASKGRHLVDQPICVVRSLCPTAKDYGLDPAITA
eukprot:4842352-Karenia_brevis.AAC.1